MFGLDSIEKYVEGKIEEMGRDLVTELISATPLGAALTVANRLSSFVETGGESELKRLLGGLGLPSELGGDMPAVDALKKMEHLVHYAYAPSRRRAKWQRGGWAKSRQEWLDEGWRHDWRSQPRDTKGRWIPGRLDYPLQRKLAVSRRQRLVRRFRNKYRKAGRSAARGIVSSWGVNNGN